MCMRCLAGSIRPLLLALSAAGAAKSAEIKAELLRFDCYFLSLNFIECRPKDRPTFFGCGFSQVWLFRKYENTTKQESRSECRLVVLYRCVAFRLWLLRNV